VPIDQQQQAFPCGSDIYGNIDVNGTELQPSEALVMLCTSSKIMFLWYAANVAGALRQHWFHKKSNSKETRVKCSMMLTGFYGCIFDYCHFPDVSQEKSDLFVRHQPRVELTVR